MYEIENQILFKNEDMTIFGEFYHLFNNQSISLRYQTKMKEI